MAQFKTKLDELVELLSGLDPEGLSVTRIDIIEQDNFGTYDPDALPRVVFKKPAIAKIYIGDDVYTTVLDDNEPLKLVKVDS